MKLKSYYKRVNRDYNIIRIKNLMYEDRKRESRLYGGNGKYVLISFNAYYYYESVVKAINKFIKLIRKYDPDNVVDLMRLTALKFK